MAIELGAAYVSILPSTNELAKPLTDAFKSSAVTSGATKAGNSLGGLLFGVTAGVGMSIMSKAMGTISSSMGNAIKRVDALNAFPRVMQNLGFSADDASRSIKKIDEGLSGLPTTIDQMAGVVQVMAPLTSSLDEATDISLALNNALLAGGKAAGDQANAMDSYVTMLSAGTVDMQRWRSVVSAMPGQVDQLAKSLLGAEANQQDLYDAMKSGEISFDDFNNELLKLNNEGLEGFASFAQQAQDATGGLQTSITNLKTAITKNLANVIAKLEPIIAPVIEGLRNFANMVGGWVVEKLGSLLDWVKQGDGAFGRLGDVFRELAPKVMEIVQGFSPLSLIFEAVKPLLPQIADLFTRIGEAVMRLVPPVLEAAQTFSNALVPIITKFVEALMPPLLRVWEAIIPIFEKIAPVIMPIVNILADLLMPVIEALLPVVETVFNAIADIISAAMTVVQGVIDVVTGLIEGDWSKVWEGIKGIFIGIWDAIVAVVKGVWETIKALFFAALNILKSVWDNTWAAIKNLFSDVWNAIVSAAGNFFNSVKTKFTQVMDFIGSIPGKIMSFFAGIGSWLVDSGKALIQGFIDGIMGAFSWAKGKVSEGLGAIRDLFPFSPAKDGPFSGSGWVDRSGASIGEAFTSSLVDSLADGRRDIASELAGVHGEFNDFDASGQAGFSLSSALPALVDSARRVTVRIGSRDFEGWIDERADGRIAEVLPSRSSVRMSLPV